MKKVTNVKVTTYAVDDDFFVDIVETDEHFHAYIYRENNLKRSMYYMEKALISKKGFIKEVERDVPEFESIYDCELEWFAEIPDDWYDDEEDEYNEDEYDEEDDGFEEECDCENCEYSGDCEYEELRGMTIVMPDLEGSEEECKDADEIRSQFISWMNSVFFTEHPLPMFRFQQWYLLRHTSASYWIANQDSLFDMFFLADSITEWRMEA